MRSRRFSSTANRKILPPGALAKRLRALQRAGRRVVFTNGCFDLLHAGHVKLLEASRKQGDALVVGINSDRSVKRQRKGPGRPITGQRDRAAVLAALESVDYVTVFDAPTPYRLIALLRPDVLIKGADWEASSIVGRDLVRRVVRIPLLKGYSTTALIRRIRRGGG